MPSTPRISGRSLLQASASLAVSGSVALVPFKILTAVLDSFFNAPSSGFSPR
ncbi:MAG: hypothetical protein LH647_23095 [Leptolyngbyaceae cyanobacterium CAN_BIN12]|nr:hypothetical protein [Leptolyngbyaceae cyanobacterium CAN_BIN12]